MARHKISQRRLNKKEASSAPATALLLIGGPGTRLRPVTYEIPKPLIPVHGKPITEHLINMLKFYGVKKIILLTGYMKEKIKEYFKDGTQLGIKIEYSEEESLLGTGGAVKHAANLIKGTFVCTNGDELKDINISEMYKEHKKNKALITIALKQVDDPSQYGVVKLDGSRILEFVEKPKKEEAPSNFISAGFYIMEPEILAIIPDGASSLEKDIFPKIAAMKKLYSYKFSGQFFDIGTMERYEKAIKEWKGIKANNANSKSDESKSAKTDMSKSAKSDESKSVKSDDIKK